MRQKIASQACFPPNSLKSAGIAIAPRVGTPPIGALLPRTAVMRVTLALFFVIVGVGSAAATPITYAFGGTVTGVTWSGNPTGTGDDDWPDWSPTLHDTFQTGMRMEGTFTYDPECALASSSESCAEINGAPNLPASATLNVGGTHLHPVRNVVSWLRLAPGRRAHSIGRVLQLAPAG